MKPARFAYHAPRDREALFEHLRQHGDEVRILAGGQSLVPAMNVRLARPDVLIDINRIGDLDFAREEGGALRIGALARHARFERLTGDGPLERLLGKVAPFIAHAPIRSRGTFLGSLAHADPAAEWCTIASVLDAVMICARHDRERRIPALDFFQGIFTTALEADEALIEARLPVLDESWTSGFAEFSRRRGDFAIAMAAVLIRLEGGVIREARIALGGVADRPLRRIEAERALIDEPPSFALVDEAARLAADRLEPMSDLHASADYRRDLAEVMARRALKEALDPP